MFGIEPPINFGNPVVNKMAFNLFAMECEEEAAAARSDEEDTDDETPD